MRSHTVRVVGGLGNQMHCYAFGRALAARNNSILYVDAESGYWSEIYSRIYLLDQFPGLNAKRSRFQPRTKLTRLLFKLVVKLKAASSRWLPISLKGVVIESAPFRYRPEIHHARYLGHTYFMGYWASYRYYQGIEKELRDELKPSIPKHPLALELLAHIRSVRSCFIHWRSYREESDVKRASLQRYYQRAIDIVLAAHPDAVFFVFSDDPAGVKKEVAFSSAKMVYVDLPASQGNMQSLTDFYLMHACDHAIVGDSTFSWWAAWLGESEGKIVIAPKGLSPWGADWLPPHWTALEANGNSEEQ